MQFRSSRVMDMWRGSKLRLLPLLYLLRIKMCLNSCIIRLSPFDGMYFSGNLDIPNYMMYVLIIEFQPPDFSILPEFKLYTKIFSFSSYAFHLLYLMSVFLQMISAWSMCCVVLVCFWLLSTLTFLAKANSVPISSLHPFLIQLLPHW